MRVAAKYMLYHTTIKASAHLHVYMYIQSDESGCAKEGYSHWFTLRSGQHVASRNGAADTDDALLKNTRAASMYIMLLQAYSISDIRDSTFGASDCSK